MVDTECRPDITVTVSHMRTVPAWSGRVGYCTKMGRVFFARHDLDWAAFVRNGIAASDLEATNDALALRVVAHARMEVENGR